MYKSTNVNVYNDFYGRNVNLYDYYNCRITYYLRNTGLFYHHRITYHLGSGEVTNGAFGQIGEGI